MAEKSYLNDMFAYKHFLMRNHMASNMVGHIYLNFAKLIIEQEGGRYMNSQMTSYFIRLDEIISDMTSDDSEWIWDCLDMEEIAEIRPEQLEADFETYCAGQLRINFVKDGV